MASKVSVPKIKLNVDTTNLTSRNNKTFDIVKVPQQEGHKLLDGIFCYRLVLDCILDGVKQYFEFDTTSRVYISESSVITQHPLVSGDIVSDHMYSQPETISITGKFSLYGQKRNSFKGGFDRLTNIQSIFKRIRKEGILCNLTMMNTSSTEHSTRFLIRKNFALTNANWTELQSSMEYDFVFSEVIFANTPTISKVDVTDENLPAITMPDTMSVRDVFFKQENIIGYVVDILYKNDWIENKCWEQFVNDFKDYTTGVIVTSVVAGIAIALCSTGVGALVVGTAIVGYGLYKIFDNLINKKRFKYEIFRYYKDGKKMKAEEDRFVKFIEEVVSYTKEFDDVLTVYQISENIDQELLIQIDNQVYSFVFVRDNTSGFYSLDINDMNGYPVKNAKSIQKVIGCSNIFECSNPVLTIENTCKHVYIMNPSVYSIVTNKSLDYYTKQTKIFDSNKDLTNLMILVAVGDMSTFAEKFAKILESNMVK